MNEKWKNVMTTCLQRKCRAPSSSTKEARSELLKGHRDERHYNLML